MRMQTIKSKDLNENVKELLNGANCYECYCDKYAPMNVPYNQLLYMKRGNELVAVKIIMASYFTTIKDKVKFASCCRENSVGGWCYLLQTPYGMEWINQVHNIRFFYTKEEYFKHLESGKLRVATSAYNPNIENVYKNAGGVKYDGDVQFCFLVNTANNNPAKLILLSNGTDTYEYQLSNQFFTGGATYLLPEITDAKWTKVVEQ